MSSKKTAYARNAVTGLATALIAESMVLVYDTAAGEDRVKPSTGTAGEIFAGFANMKAAPGQSIGIVQDGRAIPVTDVDVLQGDELTMSANGNVTKASGSAVVIGRADSSAAATTRVTVEIGRAYAASV